MQINIKAVGVELTEGIEEYVRKRLSSIARLAENEKTETRIEVELGKSTGHHKKGDFFRAEANVHCSIGNFRAVAEESDLFPAVDQIREELERQIVAKRDRGSTLFRRGARSVKKMLKGLSKRNPFTSKYDK